MHFRHFFQ